jgi:hypothetical protein
MDLIGLSLFIIKVLVRKENAYTPDVSIQSG